MSQQEDESSIEESSDVVSYDEFKNAYSHLKGYSEGVVKNNSRKNSFEKPENSNSTRVLATAVKAEALHVDNAIGYQNNVRGDYFKVVYKTDRSELVNSQKEIVSAIMSVANVMYQFHLDWLQKMKSTDFVVLPTSKEGKRPEFKMIESNVPPVVDHWVDRIEAMSELCSKIKANNNIAISGIAGSGKTQLAREFANNMQKLFEVNQKKFIVWEFSLDESGLEEGYQNFINYFKLDSAEPNKKKSSIELIQDGLDLYFPDYTIFFIYDNVDKKYKVDKLRDTLKKVEWFKNRKGCILITTQESDFFQTGNETGNEREVNLNRGLTIQEALNALDKKQCAKLVYELTQASIRHISHDGETNGLRILMEGLQNYIKSYEDSVLQKNIAEEAIAAIKLIKILDGLPLSIMAAKIYLQKTRGKQIRSRDFEEYIKELMSENQSDMEAYNDADIEYMSQYYIKNNTGYALVIMSSFTQRTKANLILGDFSSAYVIAKEGLFLVNKYDNNVKLIRKFDNKISLLKTELKHLGDFTEGQYYVLTHKDLEILDKLYVIKSADSHYQSQLSSLRMLIKLISNKSIQDTGITPLYILKLFAFFSPRNIPAFFIEKLDKKGSSTRYKIIIDTFIRTLNDHSLIQDLGTRDWDDTIENRTISLHSVCQRAVRSLLNEEEKKNSEDVCMEIITRCRKDEKLNSKINFEIKNLVGEHFFYLICGGIERNGKATALRFGQNIVESSSYMSTNFDSRWPIIIIDNLDILNIKSPIFIMEAFQNAIDCMIESASSNKTETSRLIKKAEQYFKKIVEQLSKSSHQAVNTIFTRIKNRMARIYIHDHDINNARQLLKQKSLNNEAGMSLLQTLFSNSIDIDCELFGTSIKLEKFECSMLLSDSFVLEAKISEALEILDSIEKNVPETSDIFLRYEFKRGILNLHLKKYEKGLVTFNKILNSRRSIVRTLEYTEDIHLAKAIALILMEKYTEASDYLEKIDFSDRSQSQNIYIQCVANILIHMNSMSEDEKNLRIIKLTNLLGLMNKRLFVPNEAAIFEAYMEIDQSPNEAIKKIRQYVQKAKEIKVNGLEDYSSDIARRNFYFLPKAIHLLLGKRLTCFISPHFIQYKAFIKLQNYNAALETYVQYLNEDLDPSIRFDSYLGELISFYSNIPASLKSYLSFSEACDKISKKRYQVENYQYCLGMVGRDCSDVMKFVDQLVSNFESAAAKLEGQKRCECYLSCAELIVKCKSDQYIRAFAFASLAKSSFNKSNEVLLLEQKDRHYQVLKQCSEQANKIKDLRAQLDCLLEILQYESQKDVSMSKIGELYYLLNDYKAALQYHLSAYEVTIDATKRASSSSYHSQNIIKTCEQAVKMSISNRDTQNEEFFRENLLKFKPDDVINIFSLLNILLQQNLDKNNQKIEGLMEKLMSYLRTNSKKSYSVYEKQIINTFITAVKYFYTRNIIAPAINYCKAGLDIVSKHQELIFLYGLLHARLQSLSIVQIQEIITKLKVLEQEYIEFFQLNKAEISNVYLAIFKKCKLLGEQNNLSIQNECLDSAYKTDPSNRNVQHELEIFNRTHKNLKQVVKLCKAEYEKNKTLLPAFFSSNSYAIKYYTALVEYGVSLLSSDINRAEKKFKRAEIVISDGYESQFYLGKIEFIRGNFQKAVDRLKPYINYADVRWDHCFILAFCLSQIHDNESDKIYEQARKNKLIKKNSLEENLTNFMNALNTVRKVKYAKRKDISLDECRKKLLPVVIHEFDQLLKLFGENNQIKIYSFGSVLTDIFSGPWVKFYQLYSKYVSMSLDIIEIRDSNDLLDFSKCRLELNELKDAAIQSKYDVEHNAYKDNDVLDINSIQEQCESRLNTLVNSLIDELNAMHQFINNQNKRLPALIEWYYLYQDLSSAIDEYNKEKLLGSSTKSAATEKFIELFNSININSARDDFHIKQLRQLKILLSWYLKISDWYFEKYKKQKTFHKIILKHVNNEIIVQEKNVKYDDFEYSIEIAINAYLEQQGWGIKKYVEGFFADDVSYKFINRYMTTKFEQCEDNYHAVILELYREFMEEANETSDLKVLISQNISEGRANKY